MPAGAAPVLSRLLLVAAAEPAMIASRTASTVMILCRRTHFPMVVTIRSPSFVTFYYSTGSI